MEWKTVEIVYRDLDQYLPGVLLYNSIYFSSYQINIYVENVNVTTYHHNKRFHFVINRIDNCKDNNTINLIFLRYIIL